LRRKKEEKKRRGVTDQSTFLPLHIRRDCLAKNLGPARKKKALGGGGGEKSGKRQTQKAQDIHSSLIFSGSCMKGLEIRGERDEPSADFPPTYNALRIELVVTLSYSIESRKADTGGSGKRKRRMQTHEHPFIHATALTAAISCGARKR